MRSAISGPKRPQHPWQLGTPQDISARVPRGELAGGKPATARMRAGSCPFHNGLCFHGAAANRPPAPGGRRDSHAEGTTFNGYRHLVTDGLGLNAGHALGGPARPDPQVADARTLVGVQQVQAAVGRGDQGRIGILARAGGDQAARRPGRATVVRHP